MPIESTTTGDYRTNRSRETTQSRGLCTFWLGGRLFGLEIGMVGEIVTVETVVSVPLAPPAVRGLFNLRGTPIALLDLAEVLGIAESAEAKTVAFVVRDDDAVLGLLVERIQAVVPPNRGTPTPPSDGDHPAVAHFLTLEGSHVVTVLAPAHLRERLEALRFVRKESDDA